MWTMFVTWPFACPSRIGLKPDRRACAYGRRELLRGPLYYILVLIAVTVVYWRESPAGMVAVALMCGGDGIADIVGRRFGKGNPLPHNGNKSWAGSFAMFAGAKYIVMRQFLGSM